MVSNKDQDRGYARRHHTRSSSNVDIRVTVTERARRRTKRERQDGHLGRRYAGLYPPGWVRNYLLHDQTTQ